MAKQPDWMENDPDWIRIKNQSADDGPLATLHTQLDNIAWDFIYPIKSRVGLFGFIQCVLLGLILWRVW